jgi:hypothetical protein
MIPNELQKIRWKLVVQHFEELHRFQIEVLLDLISLYEDRLHPTDREELHWTLYHLYWDQTFV